MENHRQLTDDQFERAFSDGSLPPDWFSHEAHLRLAWIHIKKYGINRAINHVQSQLQRYTQLVGATDKYHVTLTIAAVRTVYHFYLKSSSNRFPDFVEEFPQLKSRFISLIESHYSQNVYRSEAAKGTYLEPDLLPFDQ